jgi:lipoprotein NlpI
MSITCACTFTFAFQDAFGHSQDHSWFYIGIIVPKKVTAFTAHISIAYDSPGFSSFGHDPCLRIMKVLSIDKAIELKPDYAEAYCAKGGVLGLQGKYDDAIQALDQAIRLKPDLSEAYNNEGVVLVRQGKYDEAIQAYDKAIGLDPNYATAWYNKGVALKALGRTTEANAAFAKAREQGYSG